MEIKAYFSVPEREDSLRTRAWYPRPSPSGLSLAVLSGAPVGFQAH